MRFVFAIPMIAHGIGHISGFLGAWVTSSGFSERPWIFSRGITLQSPVGRAFGLLWLVPLLGFVGAGLGLIFGQPWWPAVAIAAAVVSLVVILPWWNTVPSGAKVGAAFDLLVLIVLLSPLKAWVLGLVG